jgi:F-type H+-transporting ATPase subunit b
MATTGAAENIPAAEHVGLPQLRIETFPSQLFWLVVTFTLLFLFLWRITLPRIASAIAERRNRIDGDLETADTLRKQAADTLASYEAAQAQARNRAHQLADENRKQILAEIDHMKAAADADSQAAMKEAENRILAERDKSLASVKAAAAEAATDIVERLVGIQIGAEEAANAVAASAARP